MDYACDQAIFTRVDMSQGPKMPLKQQQQQIKVIKPRFSLSFF